MNEIVSQRLNEIENCLKHEVALGVVFLIERTLGKILFDIVEKY